METSEQHFEFRHSPTLRLVVRSRWPMRPIRLRIVSERGGRFGWRSGCDGWRGRRWATTSGSGEQYMKLDSTNVFLQCMLEEDCQATTAIKTHVGALVYRGVPFGIKCIPENFQKNYGRNTEWVAVNRRVCKRYSRHRQRQNYTLSKLEIGITKTT
ncbi:hypothetical protein EVAR_43361_1 [Eumeta japonica]|uniref:Uncharacterized protein n=1 Tax=Eumeta variegata TaxID=151549 RepID=A0A4C1WSG1_EUMVA|nr:hypothetical protein EVAR_43361_1 [Eumeta japonica]